MVEKCMISACCLRTKQNSSFSYKQNEHSALPAFCESRCKHYTFTYHTSKLCTAKLWPTMPYNYTHVDRPSLIHSTCLCTWPYDSCIQFYRILKVQSVCFICTERDKMIHICIYIYIYIYYTYVYMYIYIWCKCLRIVLKVNKTIGRSLNNKMISLICAEYSNFVWNKKFNLALIYLYCRMYHSSSNPFALYVTIPSLPVQLYN